MAANIRLHRNQRGVPLGYRDWFGFVVSFELPPVTGQTIGNRQRGQYRAGKKAERPL
ncbi:MAG: hypothetical protein AB1671_02530 [Thermodesulfobacteriota bacterium]|jgi:hypothetical protein